MISNSPTDNSQVKGKALSFLRAVAKSKLDQSNIDLTVGERSPDVTSPINNFKFGTQTRQPSASSLNDYYSEGSQHDEVKDDTVH